MTTSTKIAITGLPETIQSQIYYTEKIQYKDIISIQNLKTGLERTKNTISPGIDGEIKQNIHEKRLQKLHQELMSQAYKPTPVKKIPIPKPDGGVRYLGIASQIDKVVQAAILNKLEPVLEKVFLRNSFGFRPKLGCHNALREIKYTWKDIIWIINIDIKRCFDKINHEILLKKLEKFCDQPTVELIRKLFKAGYVEIHSLHDRSVIENQSEIPRGSLISPILCNLYLHELDEYIISELYSLYNRGESPLKNPEYSKLYTLTDEEANFIKSHPEIKPSLLRLKHNEFVKDRKFAATNQEDSNYRKLHYVRYADEFILGFVGPKSEAQDIVTAIKAKLKSLKLEVNEEKSNIYHSSEKGIKYLGMYLRYFKQTKVKKGEGEKSTNDVIKQTNFLTYQAIKTTMHYRVPVDRILKRLVDREYAKNREDGTVRATAAKKLSMLTKADIVNIYNAIIRRLINYYSCVNQRSDLWKVLSILRKSCALTLGHKIGVNSAAKVYSIFGRNLQIKDDIKNTVTKIIYPTSLKTKIDFKIRGGNPDTYIDLVGLEADKVQRSTKTNLKASKNLEN